MAALTVCLPGCARVSDPLPPLVLIPRHIEALEVRQVGTKIRLYFPPPDLNTDGSTYPSMESIRIRRTREDRSTPPTSWSRETFLRESEVIAEIGAATATNDPGGTRFLYVDESVSDPTSLFQYRFHYAVEFVGKRRRTDGVSNIVGVEPLPIPAAPREIKARVSPDRIRLEWPLPQANSDGSTPPRVVGYRVYRSVEDPPRFVTPVDPQPNAENYFEDREFVFGRTVSYVVTVVGQLAHPEIESPFSESVTLTPQDTFPPAVPERLEAFSLADAVSLRWDPNEERDLAGYVVYRSEREEERGTRLTEALLTDVGYLDRSAIAQKTYYYRVTSVDARGNESDPTPPVSGSRSAP